MYARSPGPPIVVLDCDGVILDTNEAKVDAFERSAVCAGAPTSTARSLAAWQRTNFGVTREEVFSRLARGDFGPVPRQFDVESATQAYGTIVDEIYETAPLTQGLHEFLVERSPADTYVASGSSQDQLRSALDGRGLSNFFARIYGSPTPKREILARIVRERGGAARATPVVMVGDAHADADAAAAAGCSFVFAARYSLVRPSMSERSQREGHPIIQDLTELGPLLAREDTLQR